MRHIDAIAEYLVRWQPPSLMLWGRHDAFFDLAEILLWIRGLPKMEAHVFDAGHLLLETHAAAAVSLMLDFIRRTKRGAGIAAKRRGAAQTRSDSATTASANMKLERSVRPAA